MIVVVPSRGRPNNIAELVDSFYGTCRANTKLWVAVDEDDPTLEDYKDVMYTSVPPGHGKLIIGEPSRIGPILNRVMPEAAQEDDCVAFMGDDHRPRTVAWDRLYINNLRQMRTGVVYGNDLIMGEQIPTQCAMTSNIVKATGKFVPDGMIHLWLDNVWKEIGNMTNLRYLEDVIVEHLHPIAGKAAWDESYQKNNADAVFEADKARFQDWYANERLVWLNQIREYNGD